MPGEESRDRTPLQERPLRNLGSPQRPGEEVRVVAALEPEPDRAALVELRETGADRELHGEDERHRHDGPPPPFAEREEHEDGGGDPDRQEQETGRRRPERDRQREPEYRPCGGPTRQPLSRKRAVDERLHAHGREGGDGEVGEIPEPARVVQIDVAEGNLQHEAAEPLGRHEGVQREDVAEGRHAAEGDEQGAMPPRSKGERDGQ
jgi:hypothetical protein